MTEPPAAQDTPTGHADISARKQAARKAAFARRKAAHQPGRDCTGGLMAHLGALRGHVIAGYMPIRTEIDPLPAMAALSHDNTLCVPIVQGPGQPLIFRQWSPGCAMETGAFGAQIPVDAPEVTPDLLIVPLVAFTAAGYRLGYGGGFYDRTLERLAAQAPSTRAIGFAYAAQRADALPLEPTDRRLDAIVTEQGVILPA